MHSSHSLREKAWRRASLNWEYSQLVLVLSNKLHIQELLHLLEIKNINFVCNFSHVQAHTPTNEAQLGIACELHFLILYVPFVGVCVWCVLLCAFVADCFAPMKTNLTRINNNLHVRQKFFLTRTHTRIHTHIAGCDLICNSILESLQRKPQCTYHANCGELSLADQLRTDCNLDATSHAPLSGIYLRTPTTRLFLACRIIKNSCSWSSREICYFCTLLCYFILGTHPQLLLETLFLSSTRHMAWHAALFSHKFYLILLLPVAKKRVSYVSFL